MHCATSLDHHVLGFAVPDTISTNMDSWIQDVVCHYLLLLHFLYKSCRHNRIFRFMVKLLKLNNCLLSVNELGVPSSLITPPQILITSVLKRYNRNQILHKFRGILNLILQSSYVHYQHELEYKYIY